MPEMRKSRWKAIWNPRKPEVDVVPSAAAPDPALATDSAPGSESANPALSLRPAVSSSPAGLLYPANSILTENETSLDAPLPTPILDAAGLARPKNRPPGYTLWDAAYDDLLEKQPELLERYEACLQQYLSNVSTNVNSSLQDQTSTLTSISASLTTIDASTRRTRLKDISELGLKRADTRGTYTMFGKTFSLQDQAANVSSAVQWATSLISEGVKASPEASVVWAGVSIVIPLLTNPQVAEEANRDGFNYVTSRMRYYIALESAFREVQSGDHPATADLLLETEAQVKELYQSIIEFQVRSVLRFFDNWTRTTRHDILHPNQWQEMRNHIQGLEARLYKDLHSSFELSSLSRLDSVRAGVVGAEQQLTSLCRLVSSQLQASEDIKVAVQDISRKQLTDDQRKCLQVFALKQGDTKNSYEWYKSRVEPKAKGTCQWFLDQDSYKAWLSAESGPLLVTADPGCGKSVLAKSLIDDDLPRDASIAYFFFKDQDQNTMDMALCALLHQLFCSPSGSGLLLRHAILPWEQFGMELCSNTPKLVEIFRNVINDEEIGQVIIVLDALDECDPEEFRVLMEFWQELFMEPQGAASRVKCLMTSRPYGQVTREFSLLLEVFPTLHIPGEQNSDAIRDEISSVIRSRTTRFAKKLRWDETLENHLRERLLAVENRTYLWVYLVFEWLQERAHTLRATAQALDGELKRLPRTVGAAYDKTLSRGCTDADVTDFVRRALSMVLVAETPLTILEMNLALHTTDTYSSHSDLVQGLESDARFQERLRSCCGLLLSVHYGKIYFLHQTAREFLLATGAQQHEAGSWRASISDEGAHLVMAESCIAYLGLSSGDELFEFERSMSQYGAYSNEKAALVRKALDEHRFLGYAARHWGQHFREAEAADGYSAQLTGPRLFGASADSYRDLFRWSVVVHTHSFGHRFAFGGQTIHASAWMGHKRVAELLIAQGANLEEPSGDWGTPLGWAANYGYEAVVDMLIRAGAEVDAEDRFRRSVLYVAASTNRPGMQGVVGVLLAAGADTDRQDTHGATPLTAAAEYGSTQVMQKLLDAGAKINATDNASCTALMRAAWRDRLEAVELLIVRGADLQHTNLYGATALHLASQALSTTVMPILIDTGLNTCAGDKRGNTSLHYWAASTPPRIDALAMALKCLLSANADINKKNNDGNTPLHAALSNNSGFRAHLLLAAGADIEQINHNGETPMNTARELIRQYRAWANEVEVPDFGSVPRPGDFLNFCRKMVRTLERTSHLLASGPLPDLESEVESIVRSETERKRAVTARQRQ